MIRVLVAFAILFTAMPAFAETNYCGKMTKVTYQTDIYSVIRMSLVNEDRDPGFITVKDEKAITLMIAVLKEEPGWRHNSDSDDYEWSRGIVDQYNLSERCHAVLFSAVFGAVEPKMLAEWMLADSVNARLQLQLHKFIWPPDQRGV